MNKGRAHTDLSTLLSDLHNESKRAMRNAYAQRVTRSSAAEIAETVYDLSAALARATEGLQKHPLVRLAKWLGW